MEQIWKHFQNYDIECVLTWNSWAWVRIIFCSNYLTETGKFAASQLGELSRIFWKISKKWFHQKQIDSTSRCYPRILTRSQWYFTNATKLSLPEYLQKRYFTNATNLSLAEYPQKCVYFWGFQLTRLKAAGFDANFVCLSVALKIRAHH